MLNWIFTTGYARAGRYGPSKRIGALEQTVMGNRDLINTSFAERQNLTMRMSPRPLAAVIRMPPDSAMLEQFVGRELFENATSHAGA
jgi:hypothetical protein